MTDTDARFNHGLITDVFATLEAHGYTRAGEQGSRERNHATGRCVESLYRLVRDFEGVLDRDEDRQAPSVGLMQTLSPEQAQDFLRRSQA